MPLQDPLVGNLESDEQRDFKPWRCGDPYHFSRDDGALGAEKKEDPACVSNTKDGGDPWNFVREYFTTRENVRCDAWKDEVQNLLIFSGLFSAVVTAFLVESYKQLQVDTGDTTVFLLAQLVSLTNSSSSRAADVQLAFLPFSPTTSSIRINIFWFLSLVFSLTTAVIGIVSLQWVREHQRPTQGLSAREEAALLHMNAEGLDHYYIPTIFSTLPLLLLVGLVFFLIGVVDFLWQINHVVAAPILAAVAVTLAFLLVSTMIPGLQPLPMHRSMYKNEGHPPILCPYKSPQSWAFLELTALIKRDFKWILSGLQVLLINWADKHSLFIRRHFGSGLNFKRKLSWLTDIFGEDLRVNWHEHGMSWLRQRDIHSISTICNDSLLSRIIPHSSYHFMSQHDSLHALMHIQETLPIVPAAAFKPLYKCFEDFSNYSYGDEALNQAELALHLNRVLHRRYGYRGFIPLEVMEACKTESVFLVDLARLRFTTRHDHDTGEEIVFEPQQAELCIRLTRYLLSQHPGKWNSRIHFGAFGPLEYLVRFIAPFRGLSDSVGAEICNQVDHLLLIVFDHVPEHCPAEDEFESSKQDYYITSEPVRHVLEYGARLLSQHAVGVLRHTNDIIFQKVGKILQNSSDSEADYFFAITAVYVDALLPLDPLLPSSNSFQDIEWALREYKASVDLRDESAHTKILWNRLTPDWGDHSWRRILEISTAPLPQCAKPDTTNTLTKTDLDENEVEAETGGAGSPSKDIQRPALDVLSTPRKLISQPNNLGFNHEDLASSVDVAISGKRRMSSLGVDEEDVDTHVARITINAES